MRWKVADAKQKFSDVVRQANQEPQLIYNRERLVAAVVNPGTLQVFLSWHERESRRSLADTFEDLRRLVAEEDYSLEIPVRRDRPNTFKRALNDASR